MSTETETVDTLYGTVEIETVDCDSCGTTIAREEAYPFRIGEETATAAGCVREGYACPVCGDEGPAGFPERVREWAAPDSGRLPLHVALALAPVALPIMTMEGFRGTDDFTEGYATAVVTLVAWALVLGGFAYAAGWSL